MRQLLIIGIGAGDPDFITMQAIKALNRVDVFLIPDKGDEKQALKQLRLDICDRYVEREFSWREFCVPKRESEGDYKANVAQWHAEIAEAYERLLTEVPEDGVAGLLVWGDPSLYDSTLRIVDSLKERGRVAFEHEVIPGITAVQVLAAKHRIPLNRIGEPVLVTTGRKLAQGWPSEVETVVVMLDGELAFTKIDPTGLEIFWGAHLGTPSEVLVSGDLAAVADEIVEKRARSRAENGWVMDTYLIRRT
ncbi:precorrin-6A synthase (deacetylating) [Lacibacterium aquatile]|uniref:Precorrin-6A synthase [deacetylating] n=1 Tax=Lacibacterium aquatile TaxID=1168082 RepID=A0ABW5DXA5_9PROT